MERGGGGEGTGGGERERGGGEGTGGGITPGVFVYWEKDLYSGWFITGTRGLGASFTKKDSPSLFVCFNGQMIHFKPESFLTDL